MVCVARKARRCRATIVGAVKAGRVHNKRVVVDLIGVPPQARLTHIAELRELNVEHVELHAGLHDQAAPGYSVSTLLETIAGSSLPFAVAEEINTSTVGIVKNAEASIAVVGGGIYGAEDPAEAAEALRTAIIA
ncbi:orotidine 5'-phosphate decarboxylase / HUMPS family protein [Asaia sp. HN010]|uniref:orotidine 5'-phosphate decarboxylase / HUMPS family protein n=1 Tax=Asaia sp. HN010 TaxID=3081233 RepID=UPI003015C171